MITIARQTFTYFADRAKALELAAQLTADDPETDYQVVEAARGFFVAVFEEGVPVYSL